MQKNKFSELNYKQLNTGELTLGKPHISNFKTGVTAVFLCVLFACMLLAGSISANAATSSAATGDIKTYKKGEPVESGTITEDNYKQIVTDDDIDAKLAEIKAEKQFYLYFSALSTKEQDVYAEIVYCVENLIGTSYLRTGITYEQMADVFTAVSYDRPDLFWYGKENINGQGYRYGEDTIDHIDIFLNDYARDTSDNLSKKVRDDNVKAVDAEIAEILDQVENYKPWNQEYHIHKWLCEHLTYDHASIANSDFEDAEQSTTKKKELDYSIYNALVNKTCVCAGYARAFQYMLKKCGIPCYYVFGHLVDITYEEYKEDDKDKSEEGTKEDEKDKSEEGTTKYKVIQTQGEDHAWNIVKLSGRYYQVDVTWDDLWKETDASGTPYRFDRIDLNYYNVSDADLLQKPSTYNISSGDQYRVYSDRVEAVAPKSIDQSYVDTYFKSMYNKTRQDAFIEMFKKSDIGKNVDATITSYSGLYNAIVNKFKTKGYGYIFVECILKDDAKGKSGTVYKTCYNNLNTSATLNNLFKKIAGNLNISIGAMQKDGSPVTDVTTQSRYLAQGGWKPTYVNKSASETTDSQAGGMITCWDLSYNVKYVVYALQILPGVYQASNGKYYKVSDENGWTATDNSTTNLTGDLKGRTFKIKSSALAGSENVSGKATYTIGSTTKYFIKGVFQSDFNGYLSYANGVKKVFKAGILQTGTKVVYVGGKTYYIKDGVWQDSKSGVVTVGSAKYYVAKGLVQTSRTGVVTLSNTGYYIVKGKVDSSKNGLITVSGRKYYLINGVLQKKTMLYSSGGKKYYLINGVWQSGKTGFAVLSGKTYYLVSGIFQASKTGLVTWNNNKYYVVKGILQTGKSGLVTIGTGKYYLSKGVVQKKTMFYSSGGKKYYLLSGVWQKSKTGIVTVSSKKYYVKSGILQVITKSKIKIGSKYYKLSNGQVTKTY